MACDGSSEKDISVAFEKPSITSSNQTSSQQKTIVKIHLLCRVKYYLQYIKLGKAKIVLMLKQLRKKINKSSGTSFDEGYVAVNTSQLLYKKIITNVKTPQHLDSFRLSTTEITSEDNLLLQVEETVLDDTEQCQKHTHFIKNFLDDIINNALDNLEKSSDATKITTCHTNEMSAIVQQFISDDTLIRIPNNIHTPITEITILLYLSLSLMRVFKN